MQQHSSMCTGLFNIYWSDVSLVEEVSRQGGMKRNP